MDVCISKMTVLLLTSVLVLGTVLPAAAQQLAIDSGNVDLLEFHLNKALDAVKLGKVLKAQNHINWAMGLLPAPGDTCPAPTLPICPSPSDPSVQVGWFKIVTPFTWNQSSGPMPVQVGAMIDDGTPQPLYTGTVVLGMQAYGSIVKLYDQHMNQLPTTQTTNFLGGSWQGYAVLRTSTGLTQDIGLKALDPLGQIGGNSTPIHWIVP